MSLKRAIRRRLKRISFRWKFILRLLFFFFVPFIASNIYILSRQVFEIRFIHYENQLLKLKVFASEFSLILNDLVSSGKWERWSYPELSRRAPQLYSDIRTYEVDENNQSEILIPVNSSGLKIIRYLPSANYVQVFKADIIEDYLLNTTALGVDDRIFFFDQFSNPVFSNILEENMKVPSSWISLLRNSGILNIGFDKARRIKADDRQYIAVQTSTNPHNIGIISVRHAESVLHAVYSSAIDQVIFSFLLLTAGVTLLFIYQNRELKFLRNLQQMTHQLARGKSYKSIITHPRDERAVIFKNLERIEQRILSATKTLSRNIKSDLKFLKLINANGNTGIALFGNHFNILKSNKAFEKFHTELERLNLLPGFLEDLAASSVIAGSTTEFILLMRYSFEKIKYFRINIIPAVDNKDNLYLLQANEVTSEVEAEKTESRSLKIASAAREELHSLRDILKHSILAENKVNTKNLLKTLLEESSTLKRSGIAVTLVKISAWSEIERTDTERIESTRGLDEFLSSIKVICTPVARARNINIDIPTSLEGKIKTDFDQFSAAMIYLLSAMIELTENTEIQINVLVRPSKLQINLVTPRVARRLSDFTYPSNKEPEDFDRSYQILYHAAQLAGNRINATIHEEFTGTAYRASITLPV